MDLASRKSSPRRSTTRRNLFSTIINFSVSQGVKVNGNSSPSAEQGQSQTTTIPHNNCSSIEVQEVSTRNAKPRNELSVSASNLTEIQPGKSLGHAPKTFSVLTALNQSDESYREQEPEHHQRRNLRTCVSTGALSSPASSFTLPAQSPRPLANNNIHGQRMRHSDDNASVSGGSSNGYHQITPRAHPMAMMTPRRNPKSLSEEQIATINSNKNRIRANKSKERTPDWIWKIFQLAKRGRLEELKSSLVGLDPTLIRHLADAKGNTLLHCAARGGHLLTLQWLVSILGNQIEAALNDQNRAGRTVILSTLKGGQLECFEWIVLHTSSGDKALVPTEGKWSLLHFASKYGNEGVVRWLCEQLAKRHVRVDLKDAGGLTPLHVAAKAGRIVVSQELIRAGADPLAQTELGLRPCDLAFRHRHFECANYFIMAEAAGSMGKDLESIHMDFTTLHSHQETLRTHFREVLRVAKLLIKERGDLIKRFGGGNEVIGGGSSGSSPGSGGLLLSGPSNNGARLAELEHTLVLGEQGWKKLESNRVDASPKFVSNGRDLLQSRLSEFHGRFERNMVGAGAGTGGVGLMSGSSCSSDNEGSGSSVTSGDEEERTSGGDPRLKSCLRTRPRTGTAGIVSSSPLRSSNTPWLLDSDDSILSALSSPSSRNTSNNSINITTAAASQHLPNLDLLSGASTTATSSPLLLSRAGPPGRNSSSSENSPGILRSKIYTTAEIVQSSSPVPSTAAVLEVIEPTQPHSAKKPYGGQGSPINKSILRNALLSQSTPSSSPSTGTGTGNVIVDPSSTMTFMNCSVENDRNFGLSKPAAKRRVKPQSPHKPYESESHLSPSQSHSTKKELEEIYLAPDLIRGTQHRNNGGRSGVIPVIGRVIPILSEGIQIQNGRAGVQSTGGDSSLADEIYSDFEGSHFATFNSTRKSHSTDGSLAVGPKGGNFRTSRAPHISSTLSGPTTALSSESLLSFSSSAQPIIAPSPPPTITTALEFVLEDQNPTQNSVPIASEEQETNSQCPYVSVLGSPSRTNYGGSLTILPLETTNSSTTLDTSPEDSTVIGMRIGAPNTDADDPTDRISPSPSETSKTESALAPPFSHCHSEVAESSGQQQQQQKEEEGLRWKECLGPRRDSKAEGEEDKPVGIELLGVLKMRRGKDDKEDEGDSDKNCLGSLTSTAPCIIRHSCLPTPGTGTGTSPMHKTPIHHRVKKSGRGGRTAAKAWYEIDEGSDDDQESLLRVAAARARSRSTCHSTSSSLSGGEESGCSDGEMISFCDDGDGHECDSGTCTRHNCSDFV